MTTSIKCNSGFGSTNISYVPYGTIGWLKTKDNEVRQCKCLGARLVPPAENAHTNCSHLRYEWKVAGIKEHLFGSTNRLPNGIIYKSEEYAQRGSAEGYGSAGELTPTEIVSVHFFLVCKYGLGEECFHLGGSWNDILSLRTYASLKDHTITLKDTDFDIIINKNGIDVVVPMLDGVVDGIHRYPTAEKAYASMKPLKTYSLDDDEDDDAPITPKKVRLTIEVECDNVGKIKELGTIIEVSNK